MVSVEALVRGIESSSLEGKAREAAVKEIQGLDEESLRFIQRFSADTISMFIGGYLREFFDEYEIEEKMRLEVETSVCQALSNSEYSSVKK